MSIPIGRVPPFLRPAGSSAGKAPAAEAPEAPVETKSERAPARRGARLVTQEEMERQRRRLIMMQPPEQVALYRKISNAIGLPAHCRAGACKRAGSCQALKGALCIADNGEIVQTFLRAARDAASTAGERRPKPGGAGGHLSPTEKGRRAKRRG